MAFSGHHPLKNISRTTSPEPGTNPALLVGCVCGDLEVGDRTLQLAVGSAVADHVVVDAAAVDARSPPAQQQAGVSLTGHGAETRRRRRRHIGGHGDRGRLAALDAAGERLHRDRVVGERR